MHLLDDGEHYQADGGYVDANGAAITPTGNRTCTDRKRVTVSARHETGNKRFKIWGVMSQRYRHSLRKHRMVVQSIATITQLMLVNGENVFEVECEE